MLFINRRQIKLIHREIVFLPCFAHQANCCVGEIFKESQIFKTTSNRAIRLIGFFHSSVYFTQKLRDEQLKLYKKFIALISPCSTRWNSYFNAFNSLLKTKDALIVGYHLFIYIFYFKIIY